MNFVSLSLAFLLVISQAFALPAKGSKKKSKPKTKPKTGHKISTGVIVAIVIAIIVVLIVAAVLFFLWRRRSKRSRAVNLSTPPSSTDGPVQTGTSPEKDPLLEPGVPVAPEPPQGSFPSEYHTPPTSSWEPFKEPPQGPFPIEVHEPAKYKIHTENPYDSGRAHFQLRKSNESR